MIKKLTTSEYAIFIATLAITYIMILCKFLLLLNYIYKDR